MVEHVHDWHLQSFNNGSGGVTIGVADCECGHVMGPTQIERRLNATERLSTEDARLHAIAERSATPPGSSNELVNLLEAYAATLEEK